MPRFTQTAIAIKRRRIAAGLTRSKLADRLFVSTQAIKEWERHDGGRNGRGVQSECAARIARALGLPPWVFEPAIATDRIHAVSKAAEVTTVLVGLALEETWRDVDPEYRARVKAAIEAAERPSAA